MPARDRVTAMDKKGPAIPLPAPGSGSTFKTGGKPGTLDYLLTARLKEGDVSWVFVVSVQAS
jgi:hypothetical protein